jgi:hypothetical protein
MKQNLFPRKAKNIASKIVWLIDFFLSLLGFKIFNLLLEKFEYK